MEDFKSMPLGELINLWLDLATPHLDLLKPSDQYYQKKLDLEYLISNRIGLCVKDTMIFLNTKMVAAEESRTFYIRQNKEYRDNKIKKEKYANYYHDDPEDEKAKCLRRMEKILNDIVIVLQEINLNKRNKKISTQIGLARETEQKLNGVGMFLTKLSNFELKK